jgi:c-di-GMP-related signal transduction protein
MVTPAQSAAEKTSPCIARQPILTKDEDVLGYELFFHQGQEESRFTSAANEATSATIDALSVMGFDTLCDGRHAFFDCTRQMLLQDCLALLPPGKVVLEIQESVPADEEVIAACQRLRQEGHGIALDDYAPGDGREPLLEYADFVKVDIKKVAPAEAANLVARCVGRQRQMVAKKVETREEHVIALKNHFTLFQGYFFRLPEKLRVRQIPASQTSRLRLLQAISKPKLEFAEIEELVKHDPPLCYRLLRYLNSPLLGLRAPVQSVRHGLNVMGETELIRWIRMATTMSMGQEKSSDLVLASLVRARFCELLAARVKHIESDVFLMGLVSLMDAILEVPIGLVIEELSLSAETKAQLLCAKRGGTTPLSPIYDLMLAREAGEWEAVTKLAKEMDLSLYFINKSYNDSMRWAHEITCTVPPGVQQQAKPTVT